MAVIVLDFETYYDDEYSLRNLTYEEYVRDPRFEAIMCSIKNKSTGDLYCVHGETAIAKELDALHLNNCLQVAHNNAFDAFILGDHFKVEAGMYGCTMNMARVVHNAKGSMSLANLSKRNSLPDKGTYVTDMKGIRAKDMTPSMWEQYSEYCLDDTRNCDSLFDIYRPYFSAQDMNLISETLRWGAVPKYELNSELLSSYIRELEAKREQRLMRLAEVYDTDTTGLRSMLRSSGTFAQMLRDVGVEPPTKLNPAGKETYAFAKTDVAFQELGDHPDERVVTLYEVKVGTQSSIAETRALRFYNISQRGRMPFPLVPFKAHTGRHGATQKINTQNLPKRGGDKTLRRAMTAGADHAVLACDLSQIEARMLAFLAGQDDLVAQFAQGIDVYSKFGTGFYRREISKATPKERNVAKECILSLGFGAGAVSFQDRMKGAYGIDMTLEDTKELVRYYRDRHTRITSFWDQCTQAIEHMFNGEGTFVFGATGLLKAEQGKIILPDGWVLHYDDITFDGYDDYGRAQYSYFSHHHRHRKHLYSGMLANNVTQACAGRVFQWQLYKLRKRGAIMNGAVHDELNAIVHHKDIFVYHDLMTTIMRSTPSWAEGVPVDCEFDMGDNYGDLYSISEYVKQHYDDLLKYHTAEVLQSYMN